MPGIKFESIYENLLRDSVFDNRDEEELLNWIELLHTHEIQLREGCIEDAPRLKVIKCATQRAASDAVARIWGDREDHERISYRYWYRLYQSRKASGATPSARDGETGKLQRLKARLQSHPLVQSVVP